MRNKLKRFRMIFRSPAYLTPSDRFLATAEGNNKNRHWLRELAEKSDGMRAEHSTERPKRNTTRRETKKKSPIRESVLVSTRADTTLRRWHSVNKRHLSPGIALHFAFYALRPPGPVYASVYVSHRACTRVCA